MKLRQLILWLLLGLSTLMLAQKPWGWCTVGLKGPIDGGANKSKPLVIQSTGSDMHDSLQAAVRNHPYIILDGDKGDFFVSHPIELHHLTGRRIQGKNNARICTIFQLPKEVKEGLMAMRLDTLSSQGDGFMLSNGKHPHEQLESVVRQYLIDQLNDQTESYASSGIFGLRDAHNIVIQGLRLQGPGSIDIGGSDLITISGGSEHIWVDHCDFRDGMDGNFDINGKSDLITISHCRFSYSDLSFNHCLSNLIGASDNAETQGEDKLNITFAYCIWDEGCQQRMPMARFGTIHLYRCQYNCVGNQKCIDGRKDSQVLIQECTFASGVKRPYTFSENNLSFYLLNSKLGTKEAPTIQRGPAIDIPYKLH